MTDNEKIRKVLDEHPDLPVMLLTPNCGDGEYESYYHEGISAEVQSLLMPDKVNKATGSYYGLNDEKWYADKDDAVEDVSEWLFERWYDAALMHAGRICTLMDEPPGMAADDALTMYCGFEYRCEEGHSLSYMADRLARHIVWDMPWQDYVVIEAAL